MQVKTFGTLVSSTVCDSSSVQVGCLTAERLGVNITWKLQLGDISTASLPDLHSIGMFTWAAVLKKPGSLVEPQTPLFTMKLGKVPSLLITTWEELCLALGNS